MRYARNENNEKKEVSYSGEIGLCENCNSKVKGRKGEFRIKHWYHHKTRNKDCDSWYEPITEWHLEWQNLFPKKNIEVTIVKGNKKHRADILLNNEFVIEIQNSAITKNDISAREEFYGIKKMIWILNGSKLTEKSFIKTEEFFEVNNLIIELPSKLNQFENYNLQELKKELLNHTEIAYLKNHPELLDYKISSTKLEFIFKKDFFFFKEATESQYRLYTRNCYTNLYSSGSSEFEKLYSIKCNYNRNNYIRKKLIKKYWRKFIDEMKSPVFIDNLNGLNKNELYYYNENRIIEKEIFLRKLKEKN